MRSGCPSKVSESKASKRSVHALGVVQPWVQPESSEEAIHTSGKPEERARVQEEGNPSTGQLGMGRQSTGRLTRVSTWGDEGSLACGIKA